MYLVRKINKKEKEEKILSGGFMIHASHAAQFLQRVLPA